MSFTSLKCRYTFSQFTSSLLVVDTHIISANTMIQFGPQTFVACRTLFLVTLYFSVWYQMKAKNIPFFDILSINAYQHLYTFNIKSLPVAQEAPPYRFLMWSICRECICSSFTAINENGQKKVTGNNLWMKTVFVCQIGATVAVEMCIMTLNLPCKL